MAPPSTAGTHPLFGYLPRPRSLPVLSSHHVLRTLRAPSPNPLFPLCRQYVYTIRDDRRGLFDALIHFMRFLRFLRNDLSEKTSDGSRWPEQAKDNHLQSKSSNKLPSLCSTQPPSNGLLDKPLPTSMERATCVPGG